MINFQQTGTQATCDRRQLENAESGNAEDLCEFAGGRRRQGVAPRLGRRFSSQEHLAIRSGWSYEGRTDRRRIPSLEQQTFPPKFSHFLNINLIVLFVFRKRA